MNEAVRQAIAGMILADMERLVKGAEAKLGQGQVVAVEGLEQQVQQLARHWAEQALTTVTEALGEIAERQVRCRCGRLCRHKGNQVRQQETLVGILRFGRAYYYCPSCRQGYYPLDEALALPAGQFSEPLSEAMAMLGTSLPFEPAAAVLKRLVGVWVSPSAIERLTEQRGAALAARQDEEQRQLLEGGRSLPDRHPCKKETVQWVVALDAAKVHLEDGWREAKVGVVCQAQVMGRRVRRPGRADTAKAQARVDEPSGVGGAAQETEPDKVSVHEQSYMGHVGSMEEAGAKLYAEACRRGIEPWRDRLVCLADGAPGNWNQFELHFSKRVEILDWYHALEHLWSAAKAVYGEGADKTRVWVKAQERLLWQGHSQEVIAALDTLYQASGIEAVAVEANYFRTNQNRIDYAHYRECGYPIGSGVVESACKRVVAARLKGPGMCWSRNGAQAVLTLRCALNADRWQQAWPLTRPLPRAA